MGLRDYLPKFSFENMDFTSQIRVAMLLPMVPLLTAETLFFYLIIFARWNISDAFSVSVTFFSVGIVAYFMFRDKARRSITNLEPCTATHSWSKAISYPENLLIRNKVPLQEQELLRPVAYKSKRPLFDNHPMIEEIVLERVNGKLVRKTVKVPIRVKPMKVGLHEIILRDPDLFNNLIKSGKYYTELVYVRDSIAPNNVPFRRAQYIHFFPQADEFYPVPDQLIVHNAQVLTGSGAVIYAHFLYWGERLEPIPVFLIGSSPQWTEILQQAIGIKPVLQGSYSDEDNAIVHMGSQMNELGVELRRDITSTLTLGDTMEAMTYAMLLEGSQRKLEGMLDHNYTVEDQAIGLFGSWNRNRDIIRENRKFDWAKSRKLWLAVIALVAVATLAWWVLG